ncbi:MAG: hypothetical protein ACI3ZY_15795 [Parabacteroides sp.]
MTFKRNVLFFTILSAIANGDNTIPLLSQATGESSVTWFRYFTKYSDLIEMGNLPLLGSLIKSDYPTY